MHQNTLPLTMSALNIVDVQGASSKGGIDMQKGEGTLRGSICLNECMQEYCHPLRSPASGALECGGLIKGSSEIETGVGHQ